MPSQLQKVAQKEAQDHEAVDDGAPVCLHEGEVHAGRVRRLRLLLLRPKSEFIP